MCVHLGFACLHTWRLNHPCGQPVQYLTTFTVKRKQNDFFCSFGILCGLVCGPLGRRNLRRDSPSARDSAVPQCPCTKGVSVCCCTQSRSQHSGWCLSPAQRKDSLPGSACRAPPSAARGASGFLSHKGAWVVCAQLVCQDPQVPFC